MENEKKRQATYTINVPMQITFCADNDIDGEEFLKIAEKEVYKRTTDGHIECGYFDVLFEQMRIVKKETHRTREEIAEEKRAWDKFFSDLRIRGLRS